jgi:pyrophosphatase PpaX
LWLRGFARPERLRYVAAMTNPPISAVLFDLDGTLIDSVRLILDSFRHTCLAHGLPVRDEAECLAGIGIPLRVVFRTWTDDPAEQERLMQTYREYNLEHHDRSVAVYPGAAEMVRLIRGAGLRTGLVTSKNRQGALRGLRLAGIADEIEVVVGADDVENPKPHPEPVLMACRHLEITPERVVYVGDSVHDMESGRAAGARTAAALWGPFVRGDLERAEPDHWLERPEDLLEMLGLAARGP